MAASLQWAASRNTFEAGSLVIGVCSPFARQIGTYSLLMSGVLYWHVNVRQKADESCDTSAKALETCCLSGPCAQPNLPSFVCPNFVSSIFPIATSFSRIYPPDEGCIEYIISTSLVLLIVQRQSGPSPHLDKSRAPRAMLVLYLQAGD